MSIFMSNAAGEISSTPSGEMDLAKTYMFPVIERFVCQLGIYPPLMLFTIRVHTAGMPLRRQSLSKHVGGSFAFTFQDPDMSYSFCLAYPFSNCSIVCKVTRGIAAATLTTSNGPLDSRKMASISSRER